MTARIDETALRAVVATHDDAKIVAWLADAEPAGRAAAAKVLRGWLDAGESWIEEPGKVGGVATWSRRRVVAIDGSAETWHAAERAWRLCAPDGARRMRGELAVMAAREFGGDWATRFADAALRESPTWEPVRSLIRAGFVPYDRQPNYLLGMLDGLNPWQASLRAKPPLADALRADPSLLELELWDLLAIEGTSTHSLANHDKYSGRHGGTWEEALVVLANDGTISRARLLDALLASLSADFVAFRASWFSRTHDRLAPTDDEAAARAGAYLRLLGSRNPATVSMALRVVVQIERARKLDAAEFFAAADSALRNSTKSIVVTVLKTADRIARRDAGHREISARLAVDALVHTDAEVQSLALDVISRHGCPSAGPLRATLAPYVDAVAPSLRARLAGMLGEEPVAASAPEAPANGASNAVVAASAVPAVAVNLPALAAPRGLVSPLDPSRAVEPVRTFDELVALAARFLETFDAATVEVLIDGLARFGPPSTEAEVRLTRPLAKRAKAVVASHSRRGCSGCIGGTADALVDAWTGGTPWSLPFEWFADFETIRTSPWNAWRYLFIPNLPRANPGAPEVVVLRTPMLAFAFERLRRLACAFVAAHTGASALRRFRLRSTPTHRGGWIDPVVLIERIAVPGDGLALLDDVHDRVLALLRLAPDGRSDALARLDAERAASGESPEFISALRHALGAADVPVGPTEALWIAAARARAPFDDDPRVAAAFPASGPGGGHAAHLTLPSLPLEPFESQPYPQRQFRIGRTPWPPRPVPVPHPSVLLHASTDSEWGEAPPADLVAHAVSWWPANPEPLFAMGIEAVLRSAEKDAQVPQWATLLDRPDLPDARLWGGLGPELLAATLSAKQPALVQAATDILADVAACGPVDAPLAPSRLAAAIAYVLGTERRCVAFTERVPFRRFAAACDAVRALSASHAAYVAALGIEVLSRLPAHAERDALPWLAMLREALVATGGRVTDPAARAWLGERRSGKAGAVAKAILDAG